MLSVIGMSEERMGEDIKKCSREAHLLPWTLDPPLLSLGVGQCLFLAPLDRLHPLPLCRQFCNSLFNFSITLIRYLDEL